MSAINQESAFTLPPRHLFPVHGSGDSAELLIVWLRDPYIQNGFDACQFGGSVDREIRILWEECCGDQRTLLRKV